MENHAARLIDIYNMVTNFNLAAAEAAQTQELAGFSYDAAEGTLTSDSNEVFQTSWIDGVPLYDASGRILIWMQSSMKEANGIYRLAQDGSASEPWILKRSSDYNKRERMCVGQQIYINKGAQHAKKRFQLSSFDPSDPFINPIVFEEIASSAKKIFQIAGDDVETVFRLQHDFLEDHPVVQFYSASSGFPVYMNYENISNREIEVSLDQPLASGDDLVAVVRK
jgi:hypothetical protein